MVKPEMPTGPFVWVTILEPGDGLRFAQYTGKAVVCKAGDNLPATQAYADSIISSGFARLFQGEVAQDEEPEPEEKPDPTLKELFGARVAPIAKELGYADVETVREAAGTDELLAIPGVGPGKLKQIREMLDI